MASRIGHGETIMPTITLPDGTPKQFDGPVTVAAVAASIGPGLAKAAIGGRVNGELVDTSHEIVADSDIAIVTAKDDDGVEIIRHSCAHLLAQAVKDLFPSAQVTIGPIIEEGFYYDFAFERSFTPEDLEAIEKRMGELAAQDFLIERSVMGRDEAVDFFRRLGEEYKAEIISSIPEDQELSLYRQGDFIDLCRGPHVPNTAHLKAFKLTKMAGAYWRGDSKNEMLQRIYGTAWADKKALKAYLHRIEEAEKRDHRKIGKQLDLYHFQEEAPGMVFWHQKGWTLYQLVESYIREKCEAAGYQEVHTPQVLARSLWERSGHWDKFHDMIFATQSEHREYAIKPMNCPGHIQIFNHALRSYRDLPFKLAEFGVVHRNEPSGTLHGLLRARRFTQDDAHIFCTEDQLQQEVGELIDLTFEVYREFGFEDIAVALSLRPEKRVGSDEMWDKGEAALELALKSKDLDFIVQPGEGAFYGPKIEFTLRDCIGRVWQCGTVQVDFSMPERLGAKYVADDSERRVPVMIHRAILGSLERFIGILIEHHAGLLPTWLAPRQTSVLSITDQHASYASKVWESLKNQGVRADLDLRNEKIGLKIREHTLQRVPYMLIIGEREAENNTVAVRTRAGKDLGSMALCDFIEQLHGVA
jgi:threonyl-tRNA synthetase